MRAGFRKTAATLERPEPPPWPPQYRQTSTIVDALREVERHDQDLARFEADEAASRRLFKEALTQNAFGTASIEGNPLTLEEVESLLERSPDAPLPTSPDEREILNYASFIRDLPRMRTPRTVAEVERLHASLFRRVLKERGEVKRTMNFIGRRETREVVYVPTSPRRTRRELQDALDWLHQAPDPPLVRAALFFHEFQSIHPFSDGNGRMGRALTTLFLWEQGYHGVRFALIDYAFNQDREAYYAALDAARVDDWDRTPWLEYMLGVVRDAFRQAVRRFLFQQQLPPRLNARQVAVAEWFGHQDRRSSGRRSKFNDVHTAFPQIPRRTLQMDLATLVRLGVAGREGELKGVRYYLARRSS